jgi:hypothetical protein
MDPLHLTVRHYFTQTDHTEQSGFAASLQESYSKQHETSLMELHIEQEYTIKSSPCLREMSSEMKQ